VYVMTFHSVKKRNAQLAKENKKLRHYGMKLRAITTLKQHQFILQSVGCARFTFNNYLNKKQEVYRETGEILSYQEFKRAFNKIKNHPEFRWLEIPDKFALECAMEQVDDAFDRFFKGQNKYPKFKSKHQSKQSYSTKETNGNIAFDIEKRQVKLPKLGWVKVKFSKKHVQLFKDYGFNGKIKAATVSIHSSGQTHISLKIEEVVSLENEIDWTTVPLDQIIGCDLGLTHFLIDSNGNKIDNPRYLKGSLHKLADLQRQLKNKKKVPLIIRNYNKRLPNYI
jgi:putative transposase